MATSESASDRLVKFLEHGAVAHFWSEDVPSVFVSFDHGSDPGATDWPNSPTGRPQCDPTDELHTRRPRSADPDSQ